MNLSYSRLSDAAQGVPPTPTRPTIRGNEVLPPKPRHVLPAKIEPVIPSTADRVSRDSSCRRASRQGYAWRIAGRICGMPSSERMPRRNYPVRRRSRWTILPAPWRAYWGRATDLTHRCSNSMKCTGRAPLHAPTLVIQWWASMPGSLCFGPAGQLLRVLGHCAERLYRFSSAVSDSMDRGTG